MQTYGRHLPSYRLRLHTLEYYENRMECAKFISLDSVASIECQNVSSNDKMKLAFEKHGECFNISCTWQNWLCQTHYVVTSFYHWLCGQLFFFSAPQVSELPKLFPLLKSSQFRGRSSNIHCRYWTGSCFIRALSFIKLFNSFCNQLNW